MKKERFIIINRERLLKIIEDMTEVINNFLNESRLFRNRISHRYKEPSREELIEFVEGNLNTFDKVLDIAKNHLN